jgi:hypothetical protein
MIRSGGPAGRARAVGDAGQGVAEHCAARDRPGAGPPGDGGRGRVNPDVEERKEVAS